ncbi:DUF3298 and DUF4163 domain-containing protein [Brevibacillus laterosporus]|uniref:DUF3298 domain-containing protein n=2 Tax=Brevibacillus TaxID=55080 RepID=A0A0F7C0A5_BRELA|nr:MULTISPECIES: DUF3298 and DUF4163 domain-containing protein [Brevibacillus]AKF94745.1 hypothetical protein EX87_14740 [Brevibacillus laterosporus]MCR8983472.1 DUF3298 and DUF4163 domain-containing protein [Brevibacillus laterosporus]MCZ0829189.1 DUF3298 domain-containing protein [Brevibacillus halotolerans]
MKKNRVIIVGTLLGVITSSIGVAYAISLTPNSISTPANQVKKVDSVTIESKNIRSENNLLSIDLRIPLVYGLKDKRFETELNIRLLGNAMKYKSYIEDEMNQQAKEGKNIGPEAFSGELILDHQVASTGDIVSFAMETSKFTGGANYENFVDTYNIFNGAEAKILQLSDLFAQDVDFKEIVNKKIRRQIKDSVDATFYTFTSISDTQKFLVKDGNLVIQFSPYEIGPHSLGLPTFRMPLSELKDYLSDDLKDSLLKTVKN